MQRELAHQLNQFSVGGGRPLAALLLATTLLGETRHVVAIAHRGEHVRNPENTIQAFRAAVELGVDYFEVDVRTTVDGRLVVMHDGTVDRTTNGRGEVARMTFAEVRALDAGIKRGREFQGTRVPTLDEALEVAGSRVGVYLDCKSVAARPLVDAIARHNLNERAVIYGGASLLKEVLALRPTLKAMPEAVNPTVLKQLIDTLGLRVAAFGASDWNEATIAVARKAKIDIYVDRLGPADTPEIWQQAIDQGATGIQSDKPGELVRFLRSKGYSR